MPSKIHILQTDLANKIAAGEVVQRPASAVKELVENSIDAGARKIQVLIHDAGRTRIQVADDGEGMSEEDAVRSFGRHATSKITSVGDLERITTLGFRGEALASIASVAQVELVTRSQTDEVATQVRIEGSELQENTKSARDIGTTVTVKNLFYNTPARRNFLKTTVTELKNITDVVTRAAIAHPSIAWHYESDGETLLEVAPASFEQRVEDVFGERQFQSLVPLHDQSEHLTIDGFLGKPDFAKKSRVDQFVFLNRRFILSRLINHAVFQAFEHLLVRGSYPFFILALETDPRRFDVNVHPSKIEVKFENDSAVYRAVLSAVRRTLAQHDLVPTVTFDTGNAVNSLDEKLRFDRQPWNRFGSERSFQPGVGTPVFSLRPENTGATRPVEGEHTVIRLDEVFGTESGKTAAMPFDPGHPPESRILQHVSREVIEQRVRSFEGRAIWQVHDKYIISQIKSGLMIVDQHAAHERILYEHVLSNFENSLPSTQQLLFPETVELAASDYALAKELVPHLTHIGFDLKLFGKNTVVIEGIPADVRIGNEKRILQDVLDEFKNNEHASTIDVRDNLAKSFACKAAIKAGDPLNATEMIVLIDQLFATRMPYVCPHGRPVVIKVPLDELDRRFGRT